MMRGALDGVRVRGMRGALSSDSSGRLPVVCRLPQLRSAHMRMLRARCRPHAEMRSPAVKVQRRRTHASAYTHARARARTHAITLLVETIRRRGLLLYSGSFRRGWHAPRLALG
jgi:hypothetical protein